MMACGNSLIKTNTEQTTCNHKDTQSEKKSCCDSKTSDKENHCNGSCQDTNCHCPVSVNIPIPVNTFSIHFIPLLIVEKTNWAYIQNAPKPIYLSIWQPPKII